MIRVVARVSLAGFVVMAALAGVGRGAPGAEAAGPGTWTYAADMPQAFATKSGVLLRDGSVLYAAGGTSPYEPPPGGAMRYYPATDTWVETGPNVAPRIFATATLLRDGRVFLAGGIDSSTCCFTPVTTTEFYNPNTNTWSPGPTMPIGQALHEAVLTANGRVVLIGGQVHISSCLKTVQIYDPATNSIGVAADMVEDRASLGAVLLPDGRILAAGGATPCFAGDTNSTAEIYNPFTNSWTAVASMADRRIGFDMTLLPDGRAMAVGGSGPSSAVYGSEIYDPVSDTWTPTGAMNTNRAGASAVLLGNGKVLAAGGAASGSRLASAEMYDPESDTWTLVEPLNQARTFFSMTVLPDGRVLAAGGEVSTSTETATAELWDPTSWQAVAPMLHGRIRGALTLLQDGRVLASGGSNQHVEVGDTADIYDPDSDSWSPTGDLTSLRDGHSATLLKNGRVLVVGGSDGSSAETWNPATGQWMATLPLNVSRGYHTATLLQDARVFVFGSTLSAVPELYDPVTNAWTAVATAPMTRYLHDSTLLDDGRVLITGGLGSSPPLLYDPAADSWAVLPAGWPMDDHMGTAVARLANGNILFAGGYFPLPPPNPWAPSSSVTIWNQATSSFSNGTAMPEERGGDANTLYSNDVLVQDGTSALLYDFESATWSEAGILPTAHISEFSSVRLATGQILVAGGLGDPAPAHVTMYDLGIHTDTDGDGYHDGVELALGQHPWSYCATMRADVNMDGNINSIDQLKMAQNYFSRPPQERVDQDGNLRINSIDQLKLGQQIAKSVLMCP